MRVTSRRCPKCQSRVTTDVSRYGFMAWQSGRYLAQQVWPDPDVAERYVTGICPPCWDFVIGTGDNDRE